MSEMTYLREERESWRRVAERLESEKQSAESQIADLSRRLETAEKERDRYKADAFALSAITCDDRRMGGGGHSYCEVVRKAERDLAEAVGLLRPFAGDFKEACDVDEVVIEVGRKHMIRTDANVLDCRRAAAFLSRQSTTGATDGTV